eukprot:gene7406-13161_t
MEGSIQIDEARSVLADQHFIEKDVNVIYDRLLCIIRKESTCDEATKLPDVIKMDEENLSTNPLPPHEVSDHSKSECVKVSTITSLIKNLVVFGKRKKKTSDDVDHAILEELRETSQSTPSKRDEDSLVMKRLVPQLKRTNPLPPHEVSDHSKSECVKVSTITSLIKNLVVFGKRKKKTSDDVDHAILEELRETSQSTPSKRDEDSLVMKRLVPQLKRTNPLPPHEASDHSKSECVKVSTITSLIKNLVVFGKRKKKTSDDVDHAILEELRETSQSTPSKRDEDSLVMKRLVPQLKRLEFKQKARNIIVEASLYPFWTILSAIPMYASPVQISMLWIHSMICHVSHSDWQTGFHRFLDKYKENLPEPQYLSKEMLEENCNHLACTPPKTVQELLNFINPFTFPNVIVAFRNFGTIPVIACSCERSISTLKRLRTYLRNPMSETGLGVRNPMFIAM